MEVSEAVPMKCRKCRFVLLSHPQVRIEDSHGQPYDIASPPVPQEKNKCKSDLWYIPEDHMPDWMTRSLEKGEWVKGKVNCPKCEARIGSYNFVSGLRCPCNAQVVAPIHIVKSKVDFTTVPTVPQIPICPSSTSEPFDNSSTENDHVLTAMDS